MENEKEEKTIEEEPLYDFVGKANRAAEELKRLNKEFSENLARAEKLEAFKALGGRSEVRPEEAKKEESNADYARKVLSGQIKGN